MTWWTELVIINLFKIQKTVAIITKLEYTIFRS